MKTDDRPRNYRKDTLLTHVGRNPEANHGVVNPPVYHASTILSENMAEWEAKRAAPPFTGVRYGLHGTPGTFPLEDLLARIEGGYRGMLMSSGLAAVTAPLQAWPGAQFLRGHPHALRRRDELLRPADRRGHRPADPAQYQSRLLRVAGFPDL